MKRGERVRIEAGYPETLAVVFDGRTQRVPSGARAWRT